MTEQNLQKPDNGLDQATQPRTWASAAVDVLEGQDEYLVFADVPGVSKDDITIGYHDGELKLEASKGDHDLRRVFSIGPDVDIERITAEVHHGVLQVHLPKKELAKPRQIPIKAG
jgi:HSP20 family molecular chaperone IbpA